MSTIPAWWSGRTGRERLLLLAAGAALGLYVAVVLVAGPLIAGRDEARAGIARMDAALARLAALPETTTPIRPTDARAVPAIVTETAPGYDLTLRRIEPEGAGARVVVEDAGFAELLRWIAALENAHGLRLRAIEIDRRPEPGVVSARALLEK